MNNNLTQKLTLLTENDRIYTLELLRFVAAFAVFFGHYAHFYMYFLMPQQKGIFYSLNPPYGALAVPIFFLISGAIFVHTYFDKISSGKMIFIRFMQRRFARLYPLHFLTLIIVATCQAILLAINHAYFIYEFNDIRNFFLNLFFISHWGFESGYGFNGPIWSVSHEIFLYIFFFVVCLFSAFAKVRGLLFFFVCIAIALLQHLTVNFILKSAFDFFVGALIYIVLTTALTTRCGKARRLLLSAMVVLLLLLLDRFLANHGLPYGAVGPICLVGCLTLDSLIRFDPGSWFCKISSFLGNISYSTYLLHFPVQLFFLLFSVLIYKLDFSSTPVLLTYVTSVISISVLSYQFFELPIKTRLSEHFIILSNKSKH